MAHSTPPIAHSSGANPFAAKLLEASAAVYAAYATNLLLERRPEIEKRSGPGSFGRWRNHLSDRLRELAVAVAEGKPELCNARVSWIREAFRARDISEDDVRLSLECLHEVLREELPDNASAEASDILSQAMVAFESRLFSDKGLTPDDANKQLALLYLESILEGESRRAMDRIVEAIDHHGLNVQEAYLEVLLPAQREIGRLWHQGEVGVAEEHFTTSTTLRVMSILCHRAAPSSSNGQTVVAAAVAGNTHDLGARTVSDFFEMNGWRAVCLGANVPAGDIVSAVEAFDANLVVLSAVLSTHFPVVRKSISAIRESPERKVKVLVGGLAFDDAPDLWRDLGADGYSARADGAVALGRELVGLT